MKIIRRFDLSSILLRRLLVMASGDHGGDGGAKLEHLLEEARSYLETFGAAPGDFGHSPEPVL